MSESCSNDFFLRVAHTKCYSTEKIIYEFYLLGLSEPILKAIEAQGYDKPSPIQEKAVPAVLTGKDVMAAAQTGTGKTAGFTLPILEMLSKGPRVRQNQVRALVLTPTRELAAQVNGSVVKYGINLPLTSTVVFGGVKINPQMQNCVKVVMYWWQHRVAYLTYTIKMQCVLIS